MRRHLVSTTKPIKEDGFILPYITFITVLVLISVTSSIQLYQNNINMTHYEEEQLKLETLFQMGKSQLQQELSSEKEIIVNNRYIYTFPYGMVTIKIQSLDENTVKVVYDISTSNQSKYAIESIILIE